MWLSLVFSLLERMYGTDILFSTTLKALCTYGIGGISSAALTFVTYNIVSCI